MRARDAWRVLLPAALAVLAAGGCREGGGSGGAGAGGAAGGTAVVCGPAQPASLDPFVSPDQLSSDLRLLLYTPLVLYDGTEFRPYLASSWKWDDERRRLTLTIRDDVTWHDGQRLTAADVAWTLRAATDTAYGYWGSADLAGVDSIAAPDTTTVTVTFRSPFIAGVEPLAALPILPRHLLDTIPPQRLARAAYNRNPVGSGPFRFAGRAADGTLTFVRYAAFPAALGAAALDRIVFRAIPEVATLVVEVKTGSVDLCIAGAGVASEVAGSPGVRTLPLPPAASQVIIPDLRQAPLDDARVRRAFSAALRRADIADAIAPAAGVATTFLPLGSPLIDPGAAQPDDDSARAVAALDSAGWRTIDRDGIRHDAAGAPLRVTIAGPQNYQTTLTIVQSQLRRVGFDARLQLLEAATFYATILDPAKRPQAMAVGFTPTLVVNPIPYAELHSGGDSNLESYANAEVDSLLDALRTTVEPTARRDLYRALQRRVATDVPIVYTVYVPRIAVVGRRIDGVDVDLNGPFASAAKWRVRGRGR